MGEWRDIGDGPMKVGTYLAYGSTNKMPSPRMIRVLRWNRGFRDQETNKLIGGWQSHWMELPAVPFDFDGDDDPEDFAATPPSP